jgi:hypothetical protein
MVKKVQSLHLLASTGFLTLHSHGTYSVIRTRWKGGRWQNFRACREKWNSCNWADSDSWSSDDCWMEADTYGSRQYQREINRHFLNPSQATRWVPVLSMKRCVQHKKLCLTWSVMLSLKRCVDYEVLCSAWSVPDISLCSPAYDCAVPDISLCSPAYGCAVEESPLLPSQFGAS